MDEAGEPGRSCCRLASQRSNSAECGPHFGKNKRGNPRPSVEDGGSPQKGWLSRMGNECNFVTALSPNTVEVIPDVRGQGFNTTARTCREGRPVVRSPQQLRLHRALEQLGWVGVIDEFNKASGQANAPVPEPVLITTNGTLLAGFGRWHVALVKGRPEIPCIEYALDEDQSLQFILTHHQIRRGWNDFVRIRLAVTLKSSFRQRALDNMRVGGRYKGSANLPEVQRIDVSQAIANIAGVCARNVRNVETILETAHPRLIQALQDGTLKINRATQFCKLPRATQLETFIRYSEERATNNVIRHSIRQQKEQKTSLDVVVVLDALLRQEARQPGSVTIRAVRHKRTVVLLSQDLMALLGSEKICC